MKQFMILFKKDFTELYRTKKILIIGVIFILFALASPVIASMLPQLFTAIEVGGEMIEIDVPDPTIVDSQIQFISNVTQICVFTMIIALGGLIVRERRKGLYNNLLNNGVKKSNFILSKIITQVIVITGIYIVSVLLFNIYNYVLFDNFIVEHSIKSFLAVYVYLLFVISFVNFFSVISKSATLGVVLSFMTMILINIFSFFRFGNYMPAHLISRATQMFNASWYLDGFCMNIGVTLAISLALVGLSIVICKSRD